ncbi:MFS transporter [Lacticaseibacillus hulanensis]|uniref:MFS transporter n=1 Tax=Lacticaseibacillus hulanensis TaxID=2493111 RepID=UPI000FDC6CB3|nr:MFS transporter [Lacticaseibacillus hulanensis]
MGKKRSTWLIICGILLVGANLRLPITMIPPLMSSLESQIGLPASLSGMLTTIPLLMFALVSPIIGRLGSRRGNEGVLLIALVVLAAGSYLRVVPHVWALLLGTCGIGIGIAGGNVLLPAIIKDQFPTSVAAKTTLYTTAMALVASFGTATSGVIAKNTSLTWALASLSLVGLVGLIVWVLALPQMRKVQEPTAEHGQPQRSMWRTPKAWIVLIYFGLQSIAYYSLVTWLPTLWHAAGFSQVVAGNLATVFQLSGLPLSMTVPLIAERKWGLTAINMFGGGGFLIGALGLLLGSTNLVFNVVLAALMGAASGAAFSICIVFFQKRTDSAADTARLSGMAQSGGYVVAAVGPVAFGLISSALNSWTPVIWLLIVITALMFSCGVAIIKSRSVFD